MLDTVSYAANPATPFGAYRYRLGMRVQDVLKRKGHDVVTISPTATVADLLQLLVEHRIGSVVVLDEDRLVGIVSERDVIRQLAESEENIRQLPVGQLMTSEVRVCGLEDDTADLAAVMTEHRVRHLPVVDESGALLAIVSIGDVVKARLETLTDERDHLIHYVQQ